MFITYSILYLFILITTTVYERVHTPVQRNY